ncbi:NAD(P)H-dependent oxidoreductase subunit E [Motiliproteus sediminis]|uniref:NAD(P)H-dependent oxidoreductase subunit E n=1 Tax=Motiliproteus sediminis TaxID=1468178 RepID=UPI001AEF83E2|nr:NAD(P)H-dependent oxidoreductase subunit E [Motiliproteus sediminis]
MDDQTRIVNQACQRVGNDRLRLMDILLDVQRELRCIDHRSIAQIAQQLNCARIEVEEVASFYSFFSSPRKGDIAIRLCDDIVDRFQGMPAIARAFEQQLGIRMGETSADGTFSLDWTPCIGLSDQAPAALINDTPVTRLTPQRVVEIIAELRHHGDPAKLNTAAGEGNNAHPQIAVEVHNQIRHRGAVLLNDAPADAGLDVALTLNSDAILQRIEDSQLRGRGGAGFPTGRKWRTAANTIAEQRYIFCNADEGEPGTFKDRVLLTEHAELMIEGMTIAALAVGAAHGIIYLRGEYSYLKQHLESVLSQRRQQHRLGCSIGGRPGFDFDIRLQLGAGAYMCGEESALISSCEGQRGEPKTRPPFTAERGYLGYPSVVDNVETFCCAARILTRGAAWFRGFGTAASAGTKLFSICGDCDRPGIYELPFGVTVDELLIAAGARDPAAVLVGGPSGELISQTAFERRICFEDLSTAGAVVVFNDRRNILEIVEYYMAFFVEESCGYCTPCRVGNVFLHERISKVRQGLASPQDLAYLQELGDTIAKTSRCGLGQTSPNPILSSLQNFPLVYSALVKERDDGWQAGFDIQRALEESRRLAKRRSFIYDPSYSDSTNSDKEAPA